MLNRRDFIRNILRGSFVVGLATMSGVLLLREKSDKPCDFDFICQSCKQAKTCALPEGQKFRQTQKP